MKRRTKLGLSLAVMGLGAIALSSCTASFCSTTDLTRMKYAFEPGITRLVEGEDSDKLEFKGDSYTYTITGVKFEVAKWVLTKDEDPHIGNFFYESDNKKVNYLSSIIKDARDAGVKAIDGSAVEYLSRFDYLAFNTIFGKAADKKADNLKASYNYKDEADKAVVERDLSYYSYLRFSDGNKANVN